MSDLTWWEWLMTLKGVVIVTLAAVLLLAGSLAWSLLRPTFDPPPPLPVVVNGKATIRSRVPGIEGPAVKVGGILLGSSPGACNNTGHRLDSHITLTFNPVDPATGQTLGVVPYATLTVPLPAGCTKRTDTTQPLPAQVTPGLWRATLAVQFLRPGSTETVANITVASPDFQVVEA